MSNLAPKYFKKPFSVFLAVLFGLFCFARTASAWWGETLANWIATRPFFFLFDLLARLMNFIAGLAGSLLNWVLSPNFTDLSYTNPAENPVIKAGLGVTQGFVNMLLILILVYIAIATILRLAGYETRKLLVTFIVVALLVNFAPVICGLIVDASNIVMNFFVQDLKADAFGKTMGNHILTIKSGFSHTTKVGESWGFIFKIAIFSFMLSGLILFLLLFTILFILRYLVIWLLVILSPLAFACYILPITKKYFEMWWKQLINWSFIGVTCGFFLYLSLLLASPQNMSKISKPTGIDGGDPFFNSILPLLVPVIFLGIGLVFGLQTSAKGASTVIGFAKTKGKATGKWVGTKGWQATRWTGQKARAKMPERVRKWGERQMGARKWGEGETGAKGFAKRVIATIPLRYARRAAGRVVGGGIVESQQRKIQETEKSIKDTDRTPTLLRRYHKSIDDAERIGIINRLIQKGDIDDAMDEKKFGASAIKKDEMNRLTKKAKKLDSDKNLKQAFPHIAGEDDPAKIKDIISKMKPADYKNISKEALERRAVVDAILTTAMGKHINQLIEQHGKVAADALEKEMQYKAYETNKTPDKWLEDVNPRAHSYFTHAAGAGLVAIPEKAATPPAVVEKVKEEKEKLKRIREYKPRRVFEKKEKGVKEKGVAETKPRRVWDVFGKKKK